MKAAVPENTVPNPSLGSLLDNLIADRCNGERNRKLTEVGDICPTDEVRYVISLLPSTERKPACNIAKEKIKQLAKQD